MQQIAVKQIVAQMITPKSFQPYGQMIGATPDGKGFDLEDAQLDLSQGIPRFYIMRLHQRGYRFGKITHHQHCTQCLGALNGASWLMAVAPAVKSGQDFLEPDSIVAFQIPGDCFIKLEAGTWHAGPYFRPETVDFYNLELSDTNVTDHHTYNLQENLGVIYEIRDVQ
jgi:ureidoglycolate hydrolase